MSKKPKERSDDETFKKWQDEAEAIINDIKNHVAFVTISSLPSDAWNIYLNLKTIEGATFCIHISAKGFRIVSEKYDTIDNNRRVINDAEEEIFETHYAMLNRLSSRYVQSFGDMLTQKLQQLQLSRASDNDENEDDENDDDENDENDENDDDEDNFEDDAEGGTKTLAPNAKNE